MDFITISLIDQMYRHSLKMTKTRSWLVRRRNRKYFFQVTVLAITVIKNTSLIWARKEAKKGLWFPKETPIYVRDNQLMPLMREWEQWLKSLDQPKLPWWKDIFRRAKNRKSAQSN